MKRTIEGTHNFIKSLSRYTRWLSAIAVVVVIALGSFLAVHALNSSPVKLYNKKLAQPGYTLVAPLGSEDAFLVDNNGNIVHTWYCGNLAGADTQLEPNGELLREYQTEVPNNNFAMGGGGGGIELIDWNSHVTWSYVYDSNDHLQTHDALMMPNGDVMFLTWEKKDEAQAIAAGVNPANLDPKTHTTWSSSIIEIDPTNNQVVWQWNAWDHLVQDYDKTKANYGSIAANPQLINANYYTYGGTEKPDWLHVNSLSYNPQTNQVMMGVREFNEFWVIDHSTTTAQAAGHSGGNSGMGGDLLYRYGNPAAYDHGTNADRTLYLQHNDHWIPQGLPGAGDVLVFNNGDNVTGSRDYTSVEELKLPETGYTYARTSDGAYAQPEIVWTYAPTGHQKFFSFIMGNAQRLPNGDTLITDAVDGTSFEVTPSDQRVWVYKDPQYYPNEYDPSGPKTNDVYRMYKYAPSYSGLAGEDLGTQAATSTYVPGNGPTSGTANN